MKWGIKHKDALQTGSQKHRLENLMQFYIFLVIVNFQIILTILQYFQTICKHELDIKLYPIYIYIQATSSRKLKNFAIFQDSL